MGTYLVKTEENEILDILKQFTCEEGLGQPHIEYGGDSLFNAYISAKFSVDIPRCFWICKKSSDRVVISIRVLPSLTKTFQIYASLLLVAIGFTSIGCLFIIKDLAGVFHNIEPLLFFLSIVLLGLFVYRKVRYTKIALANLSLEHRFLERLKPFLPSIEKIPAEEVLPFSTCILLIYMPFLLLIFGLVKAIPLLGIAVIYCFTVLMIHSIVDATDLKLHIRWRTMLLGWISKWAVMFFMAFLGIVFFSFFGAAISCLHKGQQIKESDFLESFKRPVWCTPSGLEHSNIFATNAAYFNDLITKNHLDKNQAVMIVETTRLGLICLSLAYLIWSVQGFTDWIKGWMAVDPRTRPKLSPPSTSINGRSSHTSSLPILVTLLSGGVGNLFNFVLTIEILSVLIWGHAAFNYTVAQTIGWIAIDFKAAASGSAQSSLIGVGFLIAIMLPALITVTIWILVLLCSQIGRLKRVLYPPKDRSLAEMVGRLCSVFRLRPPILYVVKSRRSFLTTIIPWLFGRPYLIVSQVTLENLTKTDLESAIAHELAHVKYDRAIIRLTQWASFLFWYPCNAFGLLIDTEGREMRADNEAANIVGSSEAIALALVKICISQVSVQGNNEKINISEKTRSFFKPLQKRWDRIVNYGLLLRPLFWPEFVFGYAHPAVQDRLSVLYTSKAVSHNNSKKDSK